MGAITPHMRATYGTLVDGIPTDIVERVDQDELFDRLDEARDLVAKSDRAAPDLVWGYRDQARAVLEAAPRADVDQRAQQWIDKAEQAVTAEHAAACHAEARRIRIDNPSAPRRPRPRQPTAEEIRHAQWVAELKAEVAAQVRQANGQRLRSLSTGIAALNDSLADLVKAQQAGTTG